MQIIEVFIHIYIYTTKKHGLFKNKMSNFYYIVLIFILQVINVTINIILIRSWQSVLLVEKTRVSEENNWSASENLILLFDMEGNQTHFIGDNGEWVSDCCLTKSSIFQLNHVENKLPSVKW